MDLFGYQSELWYETYWEEPLRIAADFYKEKLHSGTYNNWFTQGLAAGAETAVDVTHSVLSSPVTVGKEFGEFAYDLSQGEFSLEKTPVLGNVGQNLGVSAARFVEDPNLDTGMQLVGAGSAATLTTLAPVQLGRASNVKGFHGHRPKVDFYVSPQGTAVKAADHKALSEAAISTEAVITAESRSAKLPVAKRAVENVAGDEATTVAGPQNVWHGRAPATKQSGDVADTGANTPWKLEKVADGAGAGLRGVLASKRGTEVVQRAMSRAELEYLQKHGTLRFGKVGTELDPHFVSDAVNTDLIRARLRLALPKTPELRVTLEVEKGVFGPSMKVKALEFGNGRILPGGGTERTATGVVRARVLNVDGF